VGTRSGNVKNMKNEINPKTVLARFQKQAMPTIFYRLTEEICWGFFSDEHQRMHLQTLGKHLDEYKVWLENKGKRIIEPANKVPVKILKAICVEITSKRRKIESEWVRLMLGRGWLKLEVQGTRAILTAYSGMAHSFKRIVDLAEYGDPKSYATLHDIKLDSENAALILDARKDESKQIYLSLPKILWID